MRPPNRGLVFAAVDHSELAATLRGRLGRVRGGNGLRNVPAGLVESD